MSDADLLAFRCFCRFSILVDPMKKFHRIWKPSITIGPSWMYVTKIISMLIPIQTLLNATCGECLEVCLFTFGFKKGQASFILMNCHFSEMCFLQIKRPKLKDSNNNNFSSMLMLRLPKYNQTNFDTNFVHNFPNRRIAAAYRVELDKRATLAARKLLVASDRLETKVLLQNKKNCCFVFFLFLSRKVKKKEQLYQKNLMKLFLRLFLV